MGLINSKCDIFNGTTQGWVYPDEKIMNTKILKFEA